MKSTNTAFLKKIRNIGSIVVFAVFIGGIFLFPYISKLLKLNIPQELAIAFGVPVGCLGVLILIILSVVIGMRETAHRKETLRLLAEQNGWTYAPSTTLPFLKEFDTYLNGSSWARDDNALAGSSSNVLTGKKESRNFVASDQTFTTGSHKNRKTHELTIVGIELLEADLPFMCLYPEGFFDKVFDGLSRYDIDFPQYPLFSQKYVLYGIDEGHIRSFFNPQILNFYEQQPTFTTVCGGKYLVVYGNRLLKPLEIQQQLDFIYYLANLFLGK